MTKSIITFKQNGNIELMGIKLGVWSYEDVWATKGRGHRGCHNVKCLWYASLIDGTRIIDYTRKEVKSAITMRAVELMKLANNLTEEEKQLNICNAK